VDYAGKRSWGVHDDLRTLAVIVAVGRGRWLVKQYSTDVGAWFKTQSQAFHFAKMIDD
jgi:hypothetical protein